MGYRIRKVVEKSGSVRSPERVTACVGKNLKELARGENNRVGMLDERLQVAVTGHNKGAIASNGRCQARTWSSSRSAATPGRCGLRDDQDRLGTEQREGLLDLLRAIALLEK